MKKIRSKPISAEPSAEKISRTRQKKAALALQDIGARLVTLNDAQLDKFELSPELLLAIKEARRMKTHEARRRQLQYIGSLMRRSDAGPIERTLNAIEQGHSTEVRRFKMIEQWRDELLRGDQARMQWLISSYPCIEPAKLASMVGEATDPTNPQHLRRKQTRALFRYLSMCVGEPDLG